MLKHLKAGALGAIMLLGLFCASAAPAQNYFWNPSCNGGSGGVIGQGGCQLPVSGTFTAQTGGFSPNGSGSLLVANGTTSAQIALPGSPSDTWVVVYNPQNATGSAHVRLGNSSGVSAVSTDIVVPVGAVVNIPRSSGITNIAGIMDSGVSNTNLQVFSGTGGQYLGFGGGGGGTGGGSGGNVTVTNWPATYAAPGSDATNAYAVQGVTGGEPIVTQIEDANNVKPDFTLPVPIITNDKGSTGNALNAATNNATYTVQVQNGQSIVGFDVSGLTGTGATLTLEGSYDGGANYRTINEIPLNGVGQGTTTTDGPIAVAAGGRTNVRLRVTTTGTGTITVSSNISTGSGHTVLLGNLPDTAAGDLAQIRANAVTTAANTLSTSTATTKMGNAVATDGGAPPANDMAMGAWASGALNHLITCDHSAIYDASTTGEVQIIAATVGKAIYICGWHVESPNGTVSVSLDDYNGSVHTKITPAWNLLVTNPGNADVSPFWRGVKVAAGDALYANMSGAVAVQLIVYYTIQP